MSLGYGLKAIFEIPGQKAENPKCSDLKVMTWINPQYRYGQKPTSYKGFISSEPCLYEISRIYHIVLLIFTSRFFFIK
jgi:hypothetical protein